MDPLTRFSPSYVEARAKFRAAVDVHPHRVARGSLPVLEDFTVDWAWTGKPDAQDILIYTSGVHGIEGYAGSAAQLELLSQHQDVPTLWIHAVNPWGMAHFRRVNENNVDLNRNFLPPGQPYAADDADYARVDTMLNPTGRPGTVRFFARAALKIARHGKATLTNAVARGQYSYPEGLFYGGNALQAAPEALLRFLDTQVPGRRRVMHVDLHVGRGKWGQYLAFLEGRPDPQLLDRGAAVWGERLRSWAAGTADGYDMRGGMLGELRRRYSSCRYDAVTLEFGTRGDLTIVRAMRAENQLYFHGRQHPDHPAHQRMRDVYYPADLRWQAAVLRHAQRVQQQAQAMLSS